MSEKWIEISLTEDEFFARETYAPNFQKDLKFVMLKDENGLFGPQEILGKLLTLGRHGHDFPGYKFGRRKFYKVTDRFLELALEYNDYNRRSDRERAVQERNYNFIEWLMDNS